jgi:hypothetical protein
LLDYHALGLDSIEGLLTGELLDGTSIMGTDVVRIVPPRGNGRNNKTGGATAIAVPEPTTLALAAMSLICVGCCRRRRCQDQR